VFLTLVIQHAKRISRIILTSVACLAIQHYTVTCGLSGYRALYCHLWSVWLYSIILSSVACLAIKHYTAICGLSRYKALYCHLWHVWLYSILPRYLKTAQCLEKLLNIICILFSLQKLSTIFLVLRRIQSVFITNRQ